MLIVYIYIGGLLDIKQKVGTYVKAKQLIAKYPKCTYTIDFEEH